MFSLFDRKITVEASGLLRGFTDCHCHLLPGVDDGVQTMDETLAILSRYEQLGVKDVWLTPHIMEDVPNTPADLRQHFAQLKATYRGPIALHLSAENMLDNLFIERFQSGDLLPWGKEGNRLLVETSYYTPPSNFHDLLRDIKSRGYFPMLAHPERYVYMSTKEYHALKQQGVEFQLNLFSLLGMYGSHAKDKAYQLLDEGLYNYVATDLHAHHVLETALTSRLSRKTIERIKVLSA